MYRFAVLIVLGLWPFTTHALSVSEAQQCANKLIAAYTQKQYPRSLLDVPNIIARSYGSNYRSLGPADKTLADRVAEEHLIDSFVHPTGKYHYESITVDRVDSLQTGYRVTGAVYIQSPRYTGAASFVALLGTTSCRIYQVRIHEIYALDMTLRDFLREDRRVRHFLKD